MDQRDRRLRFNAVHQELLYGDRSSMRDEEKGSSWWGGKNEPHIWTNGFYFRKCNDPKKVDVFAFFDLPRPVRVGKGYKNSRYVWMFGGTLGYSKRESYKGVGSKFGGVHRTQRELLRELWYLRCDIYRSLLNTPEDGNMAWTDIKYGFFGTWGVGLTGELVYKPLHLHMGTPAKALTPLSFWVTQRAYPQLASDPLRGMRVFLPMDRDGELMRTGSLIREMMDALKMYGEFDMDTYSVIMDMIWGRPEERLLWEELYDFSDEETRVLKKLDRPPFCSLPIPRIIGDRNREYTGERFLFHII